jgi:hypothetical protein
MPPLCRARSGCEGNHLNTRHIVHEREFLTCAILVKIIAEDNLQSISPPVKQLHISTVAELLLQLFFTPKISFRPLDHHVLC